MTSVVVHLFGRLDRGGAEMRLLEVLTGRAGRERHVVIALSGKAGALDEAFQRIGVDVVLRRLSWTFPVWFVRFLRSRRTTHVDAHVSLTSGYFLLLAAIAGARRRIAHLHSVGDGRANTVPRRAFRAGARAALVLAATDIVAVSNAVRDAQVGRCKILSRRTTIVYEQIDGERFPLAPMVSERIELLVVGRLDEGKNPERAMQLLAALRARGRLPNVRLRFAGRPSGGDSQHQSARLGYLQKRAEQLGIVDAVDFLGDRSDVPALMAASSAVLSTTHSEGLPGVIIESAAAGVPAVVSAIAANDEVARWLPSVVPVPLDATDDAWCEVIEDVITARSSRFAPTEVRAGFDRSPFALDGRQPALDELWAPATGRS